MYGNIFVIWDESLIGLDCWCIIINFFICMCLVNGDGEIDLMYKEVFSDVFVGFIFWF